MDPHTRLPTIALAQMNVRPGRPDLNTARMLAFIEEARSAGAEMIVFSEMCISGYILGDLWEIDELVRDYAGWSETVRAASAGLTVIFGNVVIDEEAIGEDGRLRKYNAVVVCHDGRYVGRPSLESYLPPGVAPKTLHPNYRFFDDDRHFYSLRKLALSSGRDVLDFMEPFSVPLHSGRDLRFGVQLCEDIWCQDYFLRGHTLDGVKAFRSAGAECVFNLSASPWTWQKNDKRDRTIREVLETSPVPLFYVNNVGAQNNGKNVLVFDGDTCAYGPDGRVRHHAPPWREHLLLVPEDEGGGVHPSPTAPANRMASIHEALLTGLRHVDHVLGGPARYLLGMSGGVDSSVVACLLAEAFGNKRVFAVNMPTRFNAEVTRENARTLAERLDLDYLSVPIETLYQELSDLLRATCFHRVSGEYSPLVDENVQARIRGADVLAGLAATHRFVFTNNGNKTEVALGYATLYGDVNGAIAPIADLYKTQVFELARYLNEEVHGREVIPRNLYDGTIVPSAELSEAQDVTKGLGDPIKYGYHDALVRQLVEYRAHPQDVMRWFLAGALLPRLEWEEPDRFVEHFPNAEAWLQDLEWVDEQLRINYFKRVQAPPIIVVSKRAFGFDLRETQVPAYHPHAYRALREAVAATDLAAAYGRSGRSSGGSSSPAGGAGRRSAGKTFTPGGSDSAR